MSVLGSTSSGNTVDSFTGRNAISVDVEDYFQVSAFEPYVDKADWSSHEIRVERNMERILELFDLSGVVGTFFFLGWIAEAVS